MKRKKFLRVILPLLLALSLSIPSYAAELPQQTQEDQTTESEVPVSGEEDGQIEGGNEENVVPPQETENTEITENTGGGYNPTVEEPITDDETAQQDAEEEPSEDAKAASEISEWTSADFTYTELSQTLNGCDYTRQFIISGRAIAGFSEAGEKKLENNKNLVLPSVDDQGTKLVGVADGAFKSKGIESVKFPEGMMVDYDDTVTNVVTRRGNFIIGTEAFAKNSLKSVYLPEGVIAVMPSAFKNNQLASVSLPHTIWWIENSSFAYNNLTTVGFPKTCDFQVQIHAFAFAHNNIKSVRIPDYTEVVEMKAFYWNPGMEECPADAPEKEQGFGGVVYMYTDNAQLANMERIHHIERTASSQKSWHQKLIVGNKPAEEGTWSAADFLIDGTVITGLSESGIEKRKTDRNLVLPDKNEAGEYITAIAGTSADNGLFATETEGFDSVTLPSHLEVIGQKAFCKNGLARIDSFPSTLRQIDLAAFQNNNLTSVVLPDSVTTLGGGAFGTNPKLEVIILSKGLTEIPAGAFGCSDAKNYMTNLTELTIPETVTKIGSNAFAGNNIKNLVIPSSVTEIGGYAFSTKNYLKDECTVTLNEGLVTIGSRAFRNKVIKEIELPSTVAALNKNTFEKEYSDGAEAVKTKVYVSKAQYSDKANFPDSSYHELALKVDPNDNVWDAYDFTYATWQDAKVSEDEITLYPAHETEKKVKLNPYLITGLSDLGTAKLEINKDIVIPAEAPDGTKVTGIGPNALAKLGLESVTFPEGVMTAYDGPADIIDEGITERGDFVILGSAFLGNKLTSVNLPEGVISVGVNAFKGNKVLTQVSLPHTLWWIGKAAFGDNAIASVDFPETCDFKLNIDEQAFAINKIKAVQLPKRTEKLGHFVFMHNTGMEPIDASAPSTWGAKKGYGVVYMYADPAVKSESFVEHYGTVGSKKSYAQKLITDEQMPEELKPWNANDFTYSDDGTTITGLSESGIVKRKTTPDMVMPDTNVDGIVITHIADSTETYGLFGAKDEPIKSVRLPANLVRIGDKAFSWSGIEKIQFPETLQEIGMSAFQADSLVSVILPDSVTTVGSGAFASNFTVENVKISSGMSEIPDGFISCSGQSAAENFKELTIPEGVTKIGANAFAGNNLKSLVIPAGVTSIGGSAFAQTQAVRSLEEIILPEGLESIGRWTFRYAKVKEVILPSTVTTLNKDAFRDCPDSGEKVKLLTSNKEQLQDHGDFVANSTYHETVYNNLIGTGWEYDDFTFEGTTVTGWSKKGNQSRLQNKNLVIPAMNPETGEEITAVGEAAFKIPDDEVTQLKDSVESPNGMQTVVIPDTITVLGKKAFEYNSLVNVAFSASLTEIGESAFHGNRLASIVLPDNIIKLGGGAFSQNDITELTLSNGLTKLEQGVFSMNIRLEQITIPNTITEIGDMAFAGARLTSLTIPESVTKIGRKAFHLHHITDLVIPGNVKEIGDSAFEGTFKAITLKTLVLEEGVETIGSLAFKEGYLESVQLPDSLKSLAADAFDSNAGTNNDHIVVCYTSNIDHLNFTETSFSVVFDSEWGVDCFTYDGTIVTGLSDKGKVLVGADNKARSVVNIKKEMIIPDGTPSGELVTGIAPGAFKGLGLTKVILPKHLETIGEEAFAENNLTSVTLPDTITKVAANAFAGNAQSVELVVKSQEASDNLKDTEFEGAALVEKIEKPADPDKDPEKDPEKDPDHSGTNGGNGNNSGKGDTNKGGDKKKGAVKTGDEAPVLPFAALAGVSLLAVVLVLKKRKRATK